MMKTILITGGSSGIGAAIVNHFLINGYFVISVSRKRYELANKNHIHICADLSNWDECIGLGKKVGEYAEQLDVLVNNVGKSEWRSLEGVTYDFFMDMFSLNLGSYFAVTKGLLPRLYNKSSIVNVSSMAGKRGSSNNSIYSATKFAINGFTQSLAKEIGPRGIRVNAVCPVLVRSIGLEEALIKVDAPAFQKGFDIFMNEFTAQQSALNRLPDTQDVADFVWFLASDQAKSITGQCINIDCGVFPQ